MSSEEIRKDIMVAWLSNQDLMKKGSVPFSRNDPQGDGV